MVVLWMMPSNTLNLKVSKPKANILMKVLQEHVNMQPMETSKSEDIKMSHNLNLL